MTASTPAPLTDPASHPDLQGPSTTVGTAPARADRFQTLNVHVPRDLDPTMPTDAVWERLMQGIDPDLATTLAACGSLGPLQVAFTPDGRRLEGGRCRSPFCIDCGPQIAERESRLLSDSVLHLTAEEGVQPGQVVFGAITMSHTHIPEAADRVRLLGGAMEAWTQQSWFSRFALGWQFAFDVAGTLGRHRGVLHAHWHVLLVLRPGVDLEHFKEKTHDWFREQLGRQSVRWNTDPTQWGSWLGPAHLTPALLNGKPGYAWKGAPEVGACLLKPGKRGEGHSSFYTRSKEDLETLVPLMKDRALMTRGGIVERLHTLLETRDEVHEVVTTLSTKRLPDALWVKLSPLSRMFLLRAIHGGKHTDAAILDLIHRARAMPLEEWEAYLLQITASARVA